MTAVWTSPPTFAQGQLIDPATLNTYLRDNSNSLYSGMPNRATLWHDDALILSGNTLTQTTETNQFFNGYAYQSAAANGDTFTHSCYLQSGTYDLNILGITNNGCGIVDWYLDGTLIQASQDWYSASTTYNVVKTVASVSVGASGYHVLKGVINGKNGSSSGYQLRLTGYWLQPHPPTMTD